MGAAGARGHSVSGEIVEVVIHEGGITVMDGISSCRGLGFDHGFDVGIIAEVLRMEGFVLRVTTDGMVYATVA